MSQGSLRLAALVASALVAPASASAATFTVDPAAAEGCSAERVCKTITAANAAVADGDVVTIASSRTPYIEPTIVVTRKNVTFQGAAGGAIVSTSTAAPGAPILRLGDGTTEGSGDGTVVRGLFLSAPGTGGPAVRVSAAGTTIDTSILVRAAPSSVDSPALVVDDAVASGPTTVTKTFLVNTPQSTSGQTAAALQGGAASSLVLEDSVVISGALQGPGVSLPGGAANVIRRSQVAAASPAADGVAIVSAASSAADKALLVDSSILVGGTNATTSSLSVVSLGSSTPGTDVAGDVAVSLVHATLAGAGRSLTLDANASGAGLILAPNPTGNLSAVVDRSILSGPVSTDNNDGIPLVAAANTVDLAVTNSDVTLPAVSSGVTVTGTGNTQNTPAALFRNVAARDFHLRVGSPVIDQAGAQAEGFSATDVDGQPRVVGAASDKGADEFVNSPPVAALAVSDATPRSGDQITFDATKSVDPDGVALASYVWTFGDGTTTTTALPTVAKTYATPGSYIASVAVVDAQGAASTTVASTTVTVRDGTAPTVRSSSPKAGAARKLYSFRTRVTRRADGTSMRRRTRTPRRITLTGTASDASGITSVEIALRRVRLGIPKATPPSSASSAPSRSRCTFLDLKANAFKVLSCAKPRYLTVPVRGGRFAYRLRTTAYPKVRAGVYEVIVRGTDAAGNVSTPVRRTFTIRVS